MKKILTTILFLTIAGVFMSAEAVIDTERLLNEDYLRNTGYSPEIIRMMNVRRVDPYAPYVEKEVKHTPVSWVKRFYQYIDPSTDNQRFGEGIIDPRLDRPSQL